MRLHRFLDDCEAEPGALCLWTFAAPEPIEDTLLVLRGHATSLVRDRDPRGAMNRNGDLPTDRRVQHAVLDEISDGVSDRGRVRPHVDRAVGGDEANRACLRN